MTSDTAISYGDELASEDITGSNIVIGLSQPGFLSQHDHRSSAELLTKFLGNISIKSESNDNLSRLSNKVPMPVVNLNITQPLLKLQYNFF